jgi:hypothetical protein
MITKALLITPSLESSSDRNQAGFDYLQISFFLLRAILLRPLTYPNAEAKWLTTAKSCPRKLFLLNDRYFRLVDLRIS